MIVAIAMGLLGGITAVYVLNTIPPKWLADYGEDPPKEAWGKRLKEGPFVPLLSALLIWAAHTMRNQDSVYLIAGFIAIWILLMIAIVDYKFMIIPDQFTIALAIVAIGLVPYQASVLSPFLGALTGAGSMLVIGFMGKLMLKKDAMGFGDVKLMCAVGILAGFKGTLIIIFLTILSSGLLLGALLLAGKVKRNEERPLGPFIAASAGMYILFKPQLLAMAALIVFTG